MHVLAINEHGFYDLFWVILDINECTIFIIDLSICNFSGINHCKTGLVNSVINCRAQIGSLLTINLFYEFYE